MDGPARCANGNDDVHQPPGPGVDQGVLGNAKE